MNLANKNLFLWVAMFAKLALGLVFAIVLASSAQGESDEQKIVKSRIQSLIAGLHENAPREQWLALGPEAPFAIRKLFDSSKNRFHRLRLIDGLSHFQDLESIEFLHSLVENAPARLEREAALRSLATLEGPRANKVFEKALGDRDPLVRVQAAKILAQSGFRTVVVQKVAQEKSPWVKKQMQSFVGEDFVQKSNAPRAPKWQSPKR